VRAIIITFSVCLLCSVCGCQDGNGKSPCEEQLGAVTDRNAQLTSKVERLTGETALLKKRVQTLAGVPEQVNLEELYRVRSIRISRYTNLYDKDKDGKLESLIVYIQPMDEDGDIIKAPGAVEVRLWDLNRTQDKALVGQWRIEANELKKLWFSTVLTVNYRFTFDIADKIKNYDQPLTVKVTFADYLSGRTFDQQRVIKPQPEVTGH
jgi:hypothetical protein